VGEAAKKSQFQVVSQRLKRGVRTHFLRLEMIWEVAILVSGRRSSKLLRTELTGGEETSSFFQPKICLKCFLSLFHLFLPYSSLLDNFIAFGCSVNWFVGSNDEEQGSFVSFSALSSPPWFKMMIWRARFSPHYYYWHLFYQWLAISFALMKVPCRSRQISSWEANEGFRRRKLSHDDFKLF